MGGKKMGKEVKRRKEGEKIMTRKGRGILV